MLVGGRLRAGGVWCEFADCAALYVWRMVEGAVSCNGTPFVLRLRVGSSHVSHVGGKRTSHDERWELTSPRHTSPVRSPCFPSSSIRRRVAAACRPPAQDVNM